MRERDAYWQRDETIGEAQLWRSEYTLRLAVHESVESHNGRIDLLHHQNYKGEKLYFHAKPYILLPDIRLTVGLHDQPRGQDVGEVRDVRWEGMRHQEVGQTQAWYYSGLGLLVIWETYLEDRFREEDPTKDNALGLLWQGFEHVLLERLPDARRVLTPAWEPIYPDNWQEFLEQMGYRRLNERAFWKRP